MRKEVVPQNRKTKVFTRKHLLNSVEIWLLHWGTVTGFVLLVIINFITAYDCFYTNVFIQAVIQAQFRLCIQKAWRCCKGRTVLLSSDTQYFWRYNEILWLWYNSRWGDWIIFSHLKCSCSSSIFISAAKHENILLSHILENIFTFLQFGYNSLSYCNLDYRSIYYAASMPNHADIYIFEC